MTSSDVLALAMMVTCHCIWPILRMCHDWLCPLLSQLWAINLGTTHNCHTADIWSGRGWGSDTPLSGFPAPFLSCANMSSLYCTCTPPGH